MSRNVHSLQPTKQFSAVKIAISQATDPELDSVKKDASLQLQPRSINGCSSPLWVDVSAPLPRIGGGQNPESRNPDRSPPISFLGDPWSLTSRCARYQTSHVIPLCLACDQEGCRSLDEVLHRLPALQDPPAYAEPTGGISYAQRAFRTCSLGYRGSAPALRR
ncbi:hypothetical protein M514_24376 [Trichuris suis]|uniref:Uncharacterized protein n=1 Tax=Trichuris suis TaxID=68888 RepID=A0A085N1V4_9BILA|nr:hypothetical protein M514_24376 [Trichuris suis]